MEREKSTKTINDQARTTVKLYAIRPCILGFANRFPSPPRFDRYHVLPAIDDISRASDTSGTLVGGKQPSVLTPGRCDINPPARPTSSNCSTTLKPAVKNTPKQKHPLYSTTTSMTTTVATTTITKCPTSPPRPPSP